MFNNNQHETPGRCKLYRGPHDEGYPDSEKHQMWWKSDKNCRSYILLEENMQENTIYLNWTLTSKHITQICPNKHIICLSLVKIIWKLKRLQSIYWKILQMYGQCHNASRFSKGHIKNIIFLIAGHNNYFEYNFRVMSIQTFNKLLLRMRTSNFTRFWISSGIRVNWFVPKFNSTIFSQLPMSRNQILCSTCQEWISAVCLNIKLTKQNILPSRS